MLSITFFLAIDRDVYGPPSPHPKKKYIGAGVWSPPSHDV